MAISVSLSGTFFDQAGPNGKAQAGTGKRLEDAFVHELLDLVHRYGGHITSGTITGDHISASVNAKGLGTVSAQGT